MQHDLLRHDEHERLHQNIEGAIFGLIQLLWLCAMLDSPTAPAKKSEVYHTHCCSGPANNTCSPIEKTLPAPQFAKFGFPVSRCITRSTPGSAAARCRDVACPPWRSTSCTWTWIAVAFPHELRGPALAAPSQSQRSSACNPRTPTATAMSHTWNLTVRKTDLRQCKACTQSLGVGTTTHCENETSNR